METASQPVTLTFDRILLNDGSAFDPPSSHFVAPVDGIYLFIFNGYSDNRKQCSISLDINGIDIAHANSSAGNVMTTNQVIVELQTDDRAWVTINANSSTDVGDLYTSFVGHLIGPASGGNTNAHDTDQIRSISEYDDADTDVHNNKHPTYTPYPTNYTPYPTDTPYPTNYTTYPTDTPYPSNYTPYPTDTPYPSNYTPYPTDTPYPSNYTPYPTDTPYPTNYTPYPTDTPYPTNYTPYPTNTPYPSNYTPYPTNTPYPTTTIATPEPSVAFTAVRSTPMVSVQPKATDTIHFDKVLCNEGSGFDHNFGTFTAPVSGHYVIMVTVSKHAIHNTSVVLENNFQSNVKLSAYTDTKQSVTSRAIAVILAGESIWLGLESGHGIGDATFSAYLINLQTTLSEMDITSKQAQSYAGEDISFSAVRISNFHSGLSPVTLIFDELFSNTGDGFAVSSSHFHAPSDGTYLFMFNAKPATTSGFKIRLLHSGDSIVGSAAPTVGQMAGNQVALSLRAFDTVWLDLQPSGSVEGDQTSIRATFSGYKLY